MNLEKFEDEITQRLKMPGVDTKVLPHVDILNKPRKTTKPQLYIILNNSTFDDPVELPGLAQLETIQGEVFIRANSRRGKWGVFDLIERITTLLLAYRLEGAKTPIYLHSTGFVAGGQNNWQYAVTFSFSAYRFATIEEQTPVKFKGSKLNIELK